MNFGIDEEKKICSIPIAGIEPLTTVDYPGKLSAVFFTMGCPWNCRYCHNSSLKNIDSDKLLSLEQVTNFLDERKGFIDGIVISGGEPTFHNSLPEFMEWLKGYGLSLALHTNGSNPEMIRTLIKKGLVDYIAMDIKSSPLSYEKITGEKDACINVARSIQIIISSARDYEFRTTYHPALLNEKELMDTVTAVHGVGAKKYFLQRFQPKGVLDRELLDYDGIFDIPDAIVKKAENIFKEFGVR